MTNIIEFKSKEEKLEDIDDDYIFSLDVYKEGEGRLFEITSYEEIDDEDMFSFLMAAASRFAPEGYFDFIEGEEDV